MVKESRKEGFHIVLTTHNSRASQRMLKYVVKKREPRLLNLLQEMALTQIIGSIIKTHDYKCTAYNICKDHVHMILICKREDLSQIVKMIKGKSSYLFNRLNENTNPLNFSNGFQSIDLEKAERSESNEMLTSSDGKGINPHGGVEREEDKQIKHDNPSNGFQPIDVEKAEKTENYGMPPPSDNEGANPLGKLNSSENKNPLWSQKFYRADFDIWMLATLDTRPGYLYLSSDLNNATYYIRNNRQKHNLPPSEELQDIIDSFLITEEEAFTT